MCTKTNGSKHAIIAKGLAEIEARKTGEDRRAFFCYDCKQWRIGAKRKRSGRGAKQRKRILHITPIHEWENEGGALYGKD